MLFSLDFIANLWYIGRVMTTKTLTKGNTMKKFYEYMTITMATVGTLCMVGAVGAIDGGYNGIPMNDNWLLCGQMALLGIASYALALYSQILYSEAK